MPVPASPKEEIIIAAECMFAARGLDGVSMRQISAAAGNANHSAVQYHFGSKDELIEAIFEYRLPALDERRRMLIARLRPSDVRSWVECYVLPILEQGEQDGSHYLGFVAVLQQSDERHLFERIPAAYLESTSTFRDAIGELLSHIPEPLRIHRVRQAMAFSIHAAADRERAQASGVDVFPFAVHVADLLDGIVGFLEAPVSATALAALDGIEPTALASPVLL